MGEMLTINEILSLIDKKFGYNTEYKVAELLQTCNVPESNKHLVSSRTILRYFDDYAQKHDVTDYTKVIHTNNKSTKGVRYDKQDVLNVIQDPDIESRLYKYLENKTKPGLSGRVPSCIYHEYIEMIKDSKIASEAKLFSATGMTKRQLDLLSVPNELLIEGYAKLIHDIKKQEDLLAELKAEYSDIKEELQSRSLI